MHVRRGRPEQLAGDERRNVHLMEEIVMPTYILLGLQEMFFHLVLFAGMVPFWLSSGRLLPCV